MSSTAPVIWQFSLSTLNALIWAVLLGLGLLMGLKMRWGRLVALTAFLTIDLIAFGAFVRLTDSGLGCPDWPGCYGKFMPLQAGAQINEAIIQQGGVDGPVNHVKAWIEMLHRYAASLIGILIAVMFVRALTAKFRKRAKMFGADAEAVGLTWPFVLLLLVTAQGLFGKWTVTLKLMPIVVTTHLMGGMLLLALLMWFWMRERRRAGEVMAMPVKANFAVQAMTWAAIGVLLLQIFLGGWVSTNYAVLACGDFPACIGSYTPEVDWRAGFTLLRELGKNPDGSYLSIEALRAIHWAHRWGALITFGVIAAAALGLLRADKRLRKQVLWIKAALLTQIVLGVATVHFAQPLLIATAHNFVAALLLALLVQSAYRVSTR